MHAGGEHLDRTCCCIRHTIDNFMQQPVIHNIAKPLMNTQIAIRTGQTTPTCRQPACLLYAPSLAMQINYDNLHTALLFIVVAAKELVHGCARRRSLFARLCIVRVAVSITRRVLQQPRSQLRGITSNMHPS